MQNFKLLSNRLDWAKAEKERRDEITYSWADLARACGASAAAVSRWKNDLNGIDSEFARPLAAFLGVDPIWLENGKGDPDTGELLSPTAEHYELIPQLDLKASCGHGTFTDYVVVKGGLSFKRDTLREWGITAKNGRVIDADGHSMEPTIGHGRVVLINLSDRTPQDNKVFLICDADGGMLLKRLIREFDPGAGGMVWKMRSDNPDKRQYADKPLPDHSSATIVGRAVWHDGLL